MTGGVTEETESSTNNGSIPELETFIFSPDIYKAEIVPRKLSPEKVGRFLSEKVDGKAKLKVFIQVEKAAKFYETFEVVEKYKKFLNKNETNPEDVCRSIIITRIIALLGHGEDINFARQYYKYLVERADSVEEFEALILLYDAFNSVSDSDVLHKKINTKSAALEAKKESDDDARIEYLELVGTVNNKLLRAEKAQEVKAEILKTSDRKKRIEEEAKFYLTITAAYSEYLQPWATDRLRRETWAVQPAEQIKREDNQTLKEDVIKCFQTLIKNVAGISDPQTEEEKFVKIRALRAIKFFAGTISEDEENFLQNHKKEQMDILANEGFMIKE